MPKFPSLVLRNAPNPTIEKVEWLSSFSGGRTKKEADKATSRIRVHYKIFGQRLTHDMTVKTKDISEETGDAPLNKHDNYRRTRGLSIRSRYVTQYVLTFKRR